MALRSTHCLRFRCERAVLSCGVIVCGCARVISIYVDLSTAGDPRNLRSVDDPIRYVIAGVFLRELFQG